MGCLSTAARHSKRLQSAVWHLLVVSSSLASYFWFRAAARNAVVVIVAALIGFALKSVYPEDKEFPITLVDYGNNGQLPRPTVPDLSLSNIKVRFPWLHTLGDEPRETRVTTIKWQGFSRVFLRELPVIFNSSLSESRPLDQKQDNQWGDLISLCP